MGVQMLLGRAKSHPGGVGTRSLPRLICSGCTRKVLKKHVEVEKGDSKLLKTALTNKSSNVRAGPKWNDAMNDAKIEAIQQHFLAIANKELDFDQVTQNTGATLFGGVPGSPEHKKFLASRPSPESSKREDKSAAEKDTEAQVHARKGKTRKVGCQEFIISQTPRIREASLKLRKFWKQHGKALTASFESMDTTHRRALVGSQVTKFILMARKNLDMKRKGLLNPKNIVENYKPLFSPPFGNGPASPHDCFLNELTNLPALSSLDKDATLLGRGLSLPQLFAERASSNCVAKDLQHTMRLLESGRLLPLGRKPGTYCCDYMHPFAAEKDVRHVVLIGPRCPTPAVGKGADSGGKKEEDDESSAKKAEKSFLTAQDVVSMSDYTDWTAPFAEKVTVYSADGQGKGGLADDLQRLVDQGAATHAAAYIYAALLQEHILNFLTWFAVVWAEEVIPGFSKDKSAFKAGTVCFRCSAVENKDGGKLLACSLCNNIYYCSRECQKLDWKRHKDYSCAKSGGK
jgi:hypothetical protein